jgi:CubicO group peptidase (beta-lactamase class C family)
VRQRIVEPLGLDDTGFTVRHDAQVRLTSIYRMPGARVTVQDGQLVRVQDRSNEQRPRLLDGGATSSFRTRPRALSGGGGWDNEGRGGMVTTAHDFARFLQMLLNGGELDGVRVLGEKTVELMLRNHLAALQDPTSFWPGVGFGFGHAVLFEPDQYGEYGSEGMIWWAGSTNVSFWIDPAEELIGILMVQVLPFGYLDIMDRFQQLVYQAIVAERGG